MAVRKIPLKRRTLFKPSANDDKDYVSSEEMCLEDDVENTLKKIRALVLKDRDLNDKVKQNIYRMASIYIRYQAMKAFVSFIRAYSKHEASFIFRVKDLDFVGVAKSLGLLRLPKMPELKDCDVDGWADASVDVITSATLPI